MEDLPARAAAVHVEMEEPAVPFTRYFLLVLKSTGLGLITIICASILYVSAWLVISPEFAIVSAARTLNSIYFAFFIDDSAIIRDVDEKYKVNNRDMADVTKDHEAIAEWLMGCVDKRFPDQPKPRDIAPALFIIPGVPPISSYTRDMVSRDSFEEADLRDAIRLLTHQEKELIQLSRDLSEHRLLNSRKARSAYIEWEIVTIISICIGTVTTILVSLSSTEFGRDHGRFQRPIRVLAIIFPALATAAAAITGFYSPQVTLGQASGTLASETQLHGQIALALWKIPCLGSKPSRQGDGTDRLDQELEGWSKRYIDIEAISVVGSGAGYQGQGGSSGSQGGETQGKGNQVLAAGSGASKPK